MKSSSVSLPSDAIAQRQIERQRDRAAERVVGNDGVGPVRPIDRAAAVGERRHPAHFLRRPREPAGLRRDRVDEVGEDGPRPRRVHQPGALQRQRTVVLREAFGEPQLAGQVGALEIERLEAARPDALDVPAVEELVRDRVEQAEPAVRDGRGRGHDRAVAVLHAVAVRVREVVREKRVGARLVVGKLAVDRALLPDDLLDVLHQAVDLPVGAGVMHGEPERRGAHGELTHHDRTELDGAVHQVLQVGRGEGERASSPRGAAASRPASACRPAARRSASPADRRGRAPT